MVGSIGILITAIGAVVVNIIVAMKTGKKVQESLDNQVAISNQVKEVHTITNSNLSAVKAELNQAVNQLSEMKVLVTDLKSERDKLATITALHTPSPSQTPTVEIPHEMNEVFKSIDINTENIDKNTQVLKTRSDQEGKK